jgi:hypothetical protein
MATYDREILRRYEDRLEEAEDAERLALAKLSKAQRDKAHWQRRIAEIKAEITA